jgi:putative membrane protein
MGGLFVRLVATAGALFAAIALVDGVDLVGVDGSTLSDPAAIVRLLVVALIFGLINAVIKPILKFATCLINLATLGLFIFVINAFLLWLTAAITSRFDLGFVVAGPIPALLGSLVVSVVSFLLNIFIRDDD